MSLQRVARPAVIKSYYSMIFWVLSKQSSLYVCTYATFLSIHKVLLWCKYHPSVSELCQWAPLCRLRQEERPNTAPHGESVMLGSACTQRSLNDNWWTLAGSLVVCRRCAVRWGSRLGCWSGRGRVSFRRWGRALRRGGGDRSRAGLCLGGAFFILLLRIELRVPLHALLHATELVDADRKSVV